MVIQIISVKGMYEVLKRSSESKPTAAIICTTYPLRQDLLRGVTVLQLHFDDFTDPTRPTAFRYELAERTRCFLDNITKITEILYVCCDSGESRSTALTAAIIRHMDFSDCHIWRNPYYHPNPLVYKIQCNAFGIRVSKLGLLFRIWENRFVFVRAIKRKDKR